MARLAALPLLVLLAACPQDIYGLDGGFPADAAIAPPVCKKAGPEFSCSPVGGSSTLHLVYETAEFTCTLPTGRDLAFKPVRSSGGLVFGVTQKVDEGLVRLRLQRDKPLPVDFTDSEFTHFLTLAYADDPDACTVQQVTTRWAGNVWVLDQSVARQAVVFDSGGEVVGRLTLDGMQSPRALARVSDGVVVGGQNGSSAALVVYSLSGDKLREIPGVADMLGSKVVRALAALGPALYLTTGRTQADGELWRALEGSVERTAPAYAGLAPITPEMVIAGATADGAYAKLTPTAPNATERASAIYKDVAGDGCTVQGAYAAAPLEGGGFIFSLRHVDAGGTPTGMQAVFSSGFAMTGRTWHLHGGAGRLAVDGPYDWLEELRPGTVLGVRESSSTIERFEISSVAQEDGGAPVGWGKTSGLAPKGLLRLR